MFSRRNLARSGLLALVGILFMQAALAAALCDWGVRAPAQVITSTGGSSASGDCHDPDGGNANLCLAHCLAGDQSLDRPLPMVVPVAVLPPGLAPTLGLDVPLHPRLRADHFHPHIAAPPLRVLYQSFLI